MEIITTSSRQQAWRWISVRRRIRRWWMLDRTWELRTQSTSTELTRTVMEVGGKLGRMCM